MLRNAVQGSIHYKYRFICIPLFFSLFAFGIYNNYQINAVLGYEVKSTTQLAAVVRIRGQVCYEKAGECSSPEATGNGIIVHESGIVLTAWHTTVYDQENPRIPSLDSPHFDRFTIYIAEDPQKPPQERYQAELLADLPEQDLALLQIITDTITDSPVDFEKSAKLPFITVSNTVPVTDSKILIAGYIGDPDLSATNNHKIQSKEFLIGAGATTTNTTSVLDPLIDEKAFIHLGFSGSPALVESNGQYQVVGIVTSRSCEWCPLVNIRNFSQLSAMQWYPFMKSNQINSSFWGENVKVAKSSPNGAVITVDLYAIDFAGSRGQLYAYAFDANSKAPWITDDPEWHRSNDQQVVFRSQPFSAQQYIDRLTNISIQIPADALEFPIEDLHFRLLALSNEKYLLWEGGQEYRVFSPPLLPTPLPTPPEVEINNPITPSITLAPTTTGQIDLTTLTGRIAHPYLTSSNKINLHIRCLPSGEKCHELPNMRQPDFSGKYLLMNGEGGQDTSIMRINPQYENQRPITVSPDDEHPQWSPDGQNLVFDSTLQGDGKHRIYWQESSDQQPSTNPRPIEYNDQAVEGEFPVYLYPDRIAYQGCNFWDGNRDCGIYTVDYLGQTKPQRATKKTEDIPSDNLNNAILFMSQRSGDWEVYSVADGALENINNLTRSPTSCDGLPTASPDGKYIAFLTNRDSQSSIYIAFSDGSMPTKLTDVDLGGLGCGDPTWRAERMSWGE